MNITSIFKILTKLLSSWKNPKDTSNDTKGGFVSIDIPQVEVNYDIQNITSTLA
jgi:hypothetical protein